LYFVIEILLKCILYNTANGPWSTRNFQSRLMPNLLLSCTQLWIPTYGNKTIEYNETATSTTGCQLSTLWLK